MQHRGVSPDVHKNWQLWRRQEHRSGCYNESTAYDLLIDLLWDTKDIVEQELYFFFSITRLQLMANSGVRKRWKTNMLHRSSCKIQPQVTMPWCERTAAKLRTCIFDKKNKRNKTKTAGIAKTGQGATKNFSSGSILVYSELSNGNMAGNIIVLQLHTNLLPTCYNVRHREPLLSAPKTL